MFLRRSRPAVVALAALVAASLAACAGKDAQEAETPPADAGMPATSPAPEPGSPQALQNEYVSLQQRLNGLQQQAMQDSVMQREYAALEEMVETKMKSVDPKLEERRQRLMELQSEMAAAQQGGENEKMQTLLEEGTAIQGLLQQTQQTTMALEEVQAGMTAFREKVMARMAEIDPEAPQLVERANAIGAQLMAASAGGPPDEVGTEPSED